MLAKKYSTRAQTHPTLTNEEASSHSLHPIPNPYVTLFYWGLSAWNLTGCFTCVTVWHIYFCLGSFTHGCVNSWSFVTYITVTRNCYSESGGKNGQSVFFFFFFHTLVGPQNANLNRPNSSKWLCDTFSAIDWSWLLRYFKESSDR